MVARSLVGFILASFVQRTLCNPQGALTGVAGTGTFIPATALPDVTGQSSSSAAAPSATGNCNFCYVVAEAAGLVWYSEVFLQTAATALVSVGVGNGSRTTTTSVVAAYPQITIQPGAAAGGAAIQAVSYASEVSISGAVLTSPTAYNVFTAYAVTSAVSVGGSCSTVSGSRSVLSSAYSETLASASGRVVLDQNGEQDFINFLGFSSCSAGGISINPTALVPVSSTTATLTSTFSGGSPLAQVQSSSSSLASPSATLASTLSIPSFSANAPLIVFGNQTITPMAQPLPLPTVNFNSSASGGSSGAAPLIPSAKPNYTTSAPTPFVNHAPGWRAADGALAVGWLITLVGVGAGLFYV